MQYEDRITIPTPEGVELELTLAGAGSRMAAALIDIAIKGAVTLAVLVVTGLMGVLGVTVETEALGVLLSAIVAVLLFLLWVGYEIFFETLASGRTPGKRATGLRVVRSGGEPVGFLASTIRNLVRLVDWLPFFYGIGLVSILVTARNQRLGDLAAATLVVREEGARRVGAQLPPADAVAAPSWDVTGVTIEDVVAIRRFLERRAGLTLDARAHLARQLAARVSPRVAGAPQGLHDERFLELIAAAKMARG